MGSNNNLIIGNNCTLNAGDGIGIALGTITPLFGEIISLIILRIKQAVVVQLAISGMTIKREIIMGIIKRKILRRLTMAESGIFPIILKAQVGIRISIPYKSGNY